MKRISLTDKLFPKSMHRVHLCSFHPLVAFSVWIRGHLFKKCFFNRLFEELFSAINSLFVTRLGNLPLILPFDFCLLFSNYSTKVQAFPSKMKKCDMCGTTVTPQVTFGGSSLFLVTFAADTCHSNLIISPLRLIVPLSLLKEKLLCFFFLRGVCVQWRRGPNGSGTLCNSCGVKWSIGRRRKRRNSTFQKPTENSSFIIHY
jgi:hypothetical protein